MSRQNTDELATKAYKENESAFADLLNTLRFSIDHNQMPTAEEILNKKSRTSKKKIPRPPNSNLLYTNLLNGFGSLDILRKFCDKYEINKQNLVPISKKLSNTLWEYLSEEHRKFFDKLALEVSLEHKKLYPDYKYQPKRKDRSGTFKHYQHQTKTESEAPIHCQPVQPINMDMAQVNVNLANDTSMSTDEFKKQMDDSLSYDSQEDYASESEDEFPPRFDENPPTSPLQTNFFTGVGDFEFVNNSNNSNNNTFDNSHFDNLPL